MLWLMYFGDQFGIFFTLSWLPLLLQADGASTAQAGFNTSMFPVGGIIGGIVLMTTIDRFGSLPVAILLSLGVPLIAAIGFASGMSVPVAFAIACAGFCVSGAPFGIGAIVSIIYPTPVRAVGAGWAQAFGRTGAIAAQFAGGGLLARHAPVHLVFLAPALSLAVAAAAAVVLTIICHRRFGGVRLGEAYAATAPAEVTA